MSTLPRNFVKPMEAKMLNTQKPEKRITTFTKVELGQLQIHSIFKTIQGEGPFCGSPCVFIRLAGCNLQCPKCDTDYTNGRQTLSFATIIDSVGQLQKGGLIVVTGGEPFRQDNLLRFLNQLVDLGYYVQIETNGTLPIPEPAVRINRMAVLSIPARFGIYIVCSPKTGSVHPSVAQNACAFKYVGGFKDICEEDGLPLTALDHSAKPKLYRPDIRVNTAPVYLQPLDDKNDEDNALNTAACVQSCLKHGYILQIQVHKIINVE